jgi:hypothetical protein
LFVSFEGSKHFKKSQHMSQAYNAPLRALDWKTLVPTRNLDLVCV